MTPVLTRREMRRFSRGLREMAETFTRSDAFRETAEALQAFGLSVRTTMRELANTERGRASS